MMCNFLSIILEISKCLLTQWLSVGFNYQANNFLRDIISISLKTEVISVAGYENR